jgi:hypothetical protein
MLCRKYNIGFVRKCFFGEKAAKLGIQKQLWHPKLQTLFEMDFCFASSMDQLKMNKITILSPHFVNKCLFREPALAAKVVSFFEIVFLCG